MTSRRPPGPTERYPGEFLLAQRRDQAGFFLNVARTYGDIATIPSRRSYEFHLLSHPNYVEQLLATRHRDFQKSPPPDAMAKLLGKGLITSNGDFHKQQRRIIQPAFHHKRIQEYSEDTVEHGLRLCERWRDGQVIDLHQEMLRVTLAIVGETLFGADVEGDAKAVGEAMLAILDQFDRMLIISLFPSLRSLERMPIPGIVRFTRARETLNAVIYRLIQERRRTGELGADFISQLLAAQEDGRGMTDQQVRDQAMTMFVAGHETTAVALTWTLYLLSRHPKVEEKLLAELQEVLGDRRPQGADLERLDYLRKVLSESQRLFPSVWSVGRQALTDVEIGGFQFPPGSIFQMSSLVVQRDPRWWPDPRRFDPDRWDPELESKRPRYSYFPFGGGPRICIGEPFAWMEASLLLATIVPRWRMRLVPGQRIDVQARATIRPKYGMKMRLERRT